MGTLTGLLYAGLVFYGLGWYLDKWTGDFSLLLFVMAVVTMLYWFAERFIFLPRRQAAAATLASQAAERRAQLAAQGIDKVDGDVEAARQKVLAQPWWLDWTAGLFPVILVVFLLRSFLFEPFKIPSGSMLPTLEVGDLILVNKFDYGVRLPVINKKIFPIHDPRRGDVMVFRFPENPSIDFIKRVVGVPGDVITYTSDKRLLINGQMLSKDPQPEYYNEEKYAYAQQFTERLGSVDHRILNYKDSAFAAMPHDFPLRENCTYTSTAVSCKVPQGHYFMMGDNRDDSQDSRVWGFVPDENIVGRAFFIWMNFGNLKRIGAFR